ncbi:MAG: DNA-directed RNA polymerase subunit beta [Patescibacteria group bacterium]|nr:DNA-directed RNA polymerase subunit beta [Patescibacteria group bacterium]
MRKLFQKPRAEVSLPNLLEIQTQSYKWFIQEGLKELFEEISPVEDFSGKVLQLEFGEYYLDEPKYSEDVARNKNLTYAAPLKCKVNLVNKSAKKSKKSEVFLGDFPLMTPQGTFIINGIERVVVTQIVRSYGVIFVSENIAGRKFFGAKIIPSRGAWLELETSPRDIISVKIDRKRKIPITALLRVLGLTEDQQIVAAFKDVDDNTDHKYIQSTLEKDPAKTYEDALVEVYKRIRPGDLANAEIAKPFLEAMLLNPKRYDLGKVGRYKMNQRLNLRVDQSLKNRILRLEDVIEVVKEIIRLNNDPEAEADDIDNLKNRRIRAVGELIQGRLRVGLLRMERIIKDRMSVLDPDTMVPSQLINSRPIQAVLQEFFASSQLSQFMDQTNPLAELEHKRRLAATGPGGLSRERAGFEVRDVHESHYGRICPIATPEGPNIGLVGQLASYARVNEYGFVETPYLLVEHKSGKSQVTKKIVYLDADKEEKAIIAPASIKTDTEGYITEANTIVRKFGTPTTEKKEKIDYVDVSPRQIVSITTALIPFVEHDDAARASMGSNMQRQAVPLVRPNSPLVGTGMESDAARYSGQIIIAQEDGIVREISGDKIVVGSKNKEKEYKLQKFVRSNQATCLNQKCIVSISQKVKKGDVLADGSATSGGELALGQNVLVAFLSFKGWNYEDAIIISERLLREDIYSSIHIEKYSVEVRDTKLGPELITRDIPNVGEEALSNLDEQGIVRIGAEVHSRDILVGKISPKGETELSAEEKLLRAIFGEKAKDVKDTSLRLPHGERGKIIDVKVFSKELGDELPPGVYQIVEISVAQFRKVSVGDKLAGRHGNKGVISKILPVEEMPFLPDGTPVDIVLNPLGVVSRMNLGQVLETHLGWAAKALNYKIATPVFEGVSYDQIQSELNKSKLPEGGKIQLYDGATGEPFDQKTTVGYIYMMKLIHMVDDKMHARSIGPYSMITQQPLGGKAQFGGQRFGEMEVWALEAYGAAHTLQEMLTIKSDDVIGRSKAYEAIIKDEQIQKPQIPASFYVLMRELQSLGLDLDMINQKKPVSEEKQEKILEKAVGEVEPKTKRIAKKSETKTESNEVEQDEELTEIMVGQEKNPPKASEEEIKE